MNRPLGVRLVEVGPRDGLQNEPGQVPTAEKVAFIEALAEAGFTTIEASSFVRADRVPQLGDAETLFATLKRRPGVRYVALVPNPRGLERALASGVTEVAVFTAASETFNRKNINRSIAGSLADIREVTAGARSAGLWVRGYISTAFGCPYEGRVARERVTEVASRLLEAGCAEISIGDTIGVATPKDVEQVLASLLRSLPASMLALHFHDTRGTALANLCAGLALGITSFDASAGGLGGCPYAPGASGNLASEDAAYLLAGLGIATGIDLEKLKAASLAIASRLGRVLPSRVLQAPPWPSG